MYDMCLIDRALLMCAFRQCSVINTMGFPVQSTAHYSSVSIAMSYTVFPQMYAAYPVIHTQEGIYFTPKRVKYIPFRVNIFLPLDTVS